MSKAATMPALVPGQVHEVPIDSIAPDPTQPRTEFDQHALDELAQVIRTRGIENPLRVTRTGVIKHGERRWRAAKQLKLKTVPVLLTAEIAAAANAPLLHYLDQVAD